MHDDSDRATESETDTSSFCVVDAEMPQVLSATWILRSAWIAKSKPFRHVQWIGQFTASVIAVLSRLLFFPLFTDKIQVQYR